MTKSEIGKIIKSRRVELGIKQSELCCGICDESVLSRIEAGRNSGSDEIRAQLIERLGMSSAILGEQIDEKNYLVRQKIREANLEYCDNKLTEALEMLNALKADYDNFSTANKQRFCTLYTLVSHDNGDISVEGRLSSLEESLKMTTPSYSLKNLPPLMSKVELYTLERIATTYIWLDEHKKAAGILSHTKKFVEDYYDDKLSAADSLSLTCYNLSLCLGQLKQYDECIRVARQGIEYSRTIRDLENLAWCMYNCAWSLLYRGNPRDKSEAQDLLDNVDIKCLNKELDLKSLSGKSANLRKKFFS
ncbi:MAG: helix-turn-helix domain-containing protein [Firmicutes bacterium]|nr:helix-turn-helix domain-containing protein [Bacillota bacterium]